MSRTYPKKVSIEEMVSHSNFILVIEIDQSSYNIVKVKKNFFNSKDVKYYQAKTLEVLKTPSMEDGRLVYEDFSLAKETLKNMDILDIEKIKAGDKIQIFNLWDLYDKRKPKKGKSYYVYSLADQAPVEDEKIIFFAAD